MGKTVLSLNGVATGSMESDFARELLDDERLVGYFETTTPLKRLAGPDASAGLIAFLVGQDAARSSGPVIVADGGLSVTGGC